MTTKLTLLALQSEHEAVFREEQSAHTGGTMKPKRSDLESLYREYFIEIRKFSPFPMELSYENVLDFAEWLRSQPQ